MKKVFIAVVFLFCCLCVNAQNESRIVINDLNPETGCRGLSTSAILVRNGMSDKYPLQVCLIADNESPNGWQYTMRITVTQLESLAIPKGGVLLLRTSSGEVIELANNLDSYLSRDPLGTWVEAASVMIYNNAGHYPVTREQLESIAAGVVKIRMQIGGNTFDTEYKKDRLGAAVSAHMAVIDKAISEVSDIREGF